MRARSALEIAPALPEKMGAKLKLVDTESGVIDRAIAIAEKRRDTLLRLKAAIRAKHWKEADQLITELVPDDVKTCDRANQSIHRIAGRR